MCSYTMQLLCLCIEKPQVEHETQSRKEETEPLHSEYKLFMQYHSRLSDMPSLVDLTSYFVTASIISRSDGETIINTITMESRTVALRKLLEKLPLTLLRARGDNKVFEKILRIMQIYGSDTVRLVADEMLEEVIRAPLSVQITLYNTGTYIKKISYSYINMYLINNVYLYTRYIIQLTS